MPDEIYKALKKRAEEKRYMNNTVTLLLNDREFETVNKKAATLRMSMEELLCQYLIGSYAFQELPNEYEVNYQSYESFVSLITSQKDFSSALLEKIFSTDGIGSIFMNIENHDVYIEKNYFGRVIRDLIMQDERQQYENDFLIEGEDQVYDRDKIGDIARLLDFDGKVFQTFGMNEQKILFNLLLRVGCSEERHIIGWFLKLSSKMHDSINNFLVNIKGNSIALLLDKGTSVIEQKAKSQKNITLLS